MNLLFSWLILSAAFLATAWLLPGMRVKGVGGAVGGAAVFGILNWLLGKALFILFGIATLGLGFILVFVTAWVVNVVLLKLTDAMTDSVELKSTGTAMAAALLISGISGILRLVF